jgi:hypothetical protein
MLKIYPNISLKVLTLDTKIIIIIIIIIMSLQPSVGPWPQFLDPVHSRYESLDGWSACRKAATYTQDNTNTEQTHTDIHVLSGIRTHDRSIPTNERQLIQLNRAATVIARTQKERGINKLYRLLQHTSPVFWNFKEQNWVTKKFNGQESVSRSRSEPRIARIQNRIASHFTATPGINQE